MKNRLTPVLLAALLASVGFAAQAATSPTPSAASAGFSIDLAKRGADDAAGDDRGGRGRGKDDGANHARRGADDAAGDDRGGRGRGKDDGANHARRGADDAAGDDRGGRGRGKDDGANHA